jgi:hypothetical protein
VTFLPLEGWPSRVSRSPWTGRDANRDLYPPMDFVLLQGKPGTSCPPPDSARLRVRRRFGRPALLRFHAPTAYRATGSDQHRVCLTRLCCAFRLSQPLDAFFLPKPHGLVSCRDAHGVSPSEVFPPAPPTPPLGAPAPPGVLRRPLVLPPQILVRSPYLHPSRLRSGEHIVTLRPVLRSGRASRGFEPGLGSVHPADRD